MQYLSTLFVALLFLVLSSCGDDSNVQITEENVPNPPVHLNKPRPGASDEDPTVVPTPPSSPVPDFPSRTGGDIDTPVEVPPLPRVGRPTSGSSSASFSVVEPGSTNIVDSVSLPNGSTVSCQRVRNSITRDFELQLTPYWRISFEGPAEANQTKPSIQINFYGDLTTQGESTIAGNGRRMWKWSLMEETYRFSSLVINRGGERSGSLRHRNRYQNASSDDQSSQCQISLHARADGRISGSFHCDQLKNDYNEWMAAFGEFECPLSNSNLFPPSNEEVAPSIFNSLIPRGI